MSVLALILSMATPNCSKVLKCSFSGEIHLYIRIVPTRAQKPPENNENSDMQESRLTLIAVPEDVYS